MDDRTRRLNEKKFKEIYNGLGELVEIHRKFPVYTGHHPVHGGKNHDHQA